jgi:pSer/pThr/pTyr-binding forkhead associated (FHA) protein
MSAPVARPRARLVAMTAEAKAALGGRDEVVLDTFPFRIGRESRTNPIARAVASVERRLGTVPQLNDLYLREPEGGAAQISRRHCDIEHQAGLFFLRDRASATGATIIQARPAAVGREVQILRAGGVGFNARVELHGGDVIVLGTDNSQQVFRFQVDSQREPLPPAVGARSVIVLDADFFTPED